MQIQAKILEITARYPAEKRFSLAIMQDIQRELNYIPPEALPLIKQHVGASEGQLYALATFYKALSLKPKGRHIIKLCDGTACHLRGAPNLISGIKRHLGIDPGDTTADGEFSLELVNCVGSCALAPVMIIDETYYSKVTVESLPRILDACREAADPSEQDEQGRGGPGGGLDE
jgi:NADH-quinone oxidoreductase subunit E